MDLDDFDVVLEDTSLSPSCSFSALEALDYLDIQWYTAATRRARWMDLIGDYAGSEMFVMDGDSLLDVVLSDPLLALARPNEPSFQILHAIYLLESLINEFLKRSAMFEICFWQDNRHMAVQTGGPQWVVSSRSLARALLLKHLETMAIPVHIFDNLAAPEWLGFRALKRPMFIMANDGGPADIPGHLHAERTLRQRTFIFDILSQGLAVCPLRGVEFRDSKILTFVYESRRNLEARKEFRAELWTASEKALDTLDSVSPLEPRVLVPELLDLDSCLVETARRFLSVESWSAEFSEELLYAFIIHSLIVATMSVEERVRPLEPLHSELDAHLVETFLPRVFQILKGVISSSDATLDIDGRVFVSLLRYLLCTKSIALSELLGSALSSQFQSIWSSLGSFLIDFQSMASRFNCPDFTVDVASMPPSRRLLAFDNELFNAELSSVHIQVDEQDQGPVRGPRHLEFGTGTMFSDTQHWHDHRRSILPKYMGGEDTKPKDARERRWKLRRDQRFMRNLQWHAATLTGASGSILKQITISPVDRGGKIRKGKQVVVLRADKTAALERSKKGHAENQKQKKLSSRDKLRGQIAEEKQTKEEDEDKVWWCDQLKVLGKMSVSDQLGQLRSLSRNKRSQVGWLSLELKVYGLHLEISLWKYDPNQESASVRDRYSVTIIRTVKEAYESKYLTETVAKVLDSILITLGFGDYIDALRSSGCAASTVDRPLSFKFIKLLRSKTNVSYYEFMRIVEHPIVWQLRLFGEFMDRSMDSQPDSRVSFAPDAWQREVLDCIDNDMSVLVVAPTSAGKTFISYYAMEDVLRSSDDGILVYVAPTKALVTQIAAEVYARFNKDVKGRSFWAIHTRDYRINNPQNCQILVTVPEVLATLLLSPPLARVWMPRIKRIILDEIHSIGQQEGGAVWEQILLLAPCPIIGLSATVGEAETFNNWLSSLQNAHGYKHKFIHHPHRYSHLRKFNYVLDTVSSRSRFSGLDTYKSTDRLRFLHPMSMLSSGTQALPPDLSLEASDTLTLYSALKSCGGSVSVEMDSLDPIRYFPRPLFLRQKDIIDYETKLKSVVSTFLASSDPEDTSSPLRQVIRELTDPVIAQIPEAVRNNAPSKEIFRSNIINLVSDLHVSGDLPALLFSFDRSYCEIMAKDLLNSLSEAEDKWRKTNPQWRNKVKQWELWRMRSKEREHMAERAKKQKKNSDFPETADAQNATWEASFDPSEPSLEFSFAGSSAYSKTDLEDDILHLGRRGSVPEWTLDALRRGIAVHHSGMNKQYRSLVESLFRLGYLRVVIATGTLALGINAPTKTSVFCGDSPFLTALMYRQCAGRAGRRGYDLLGKVVFYGLPLDRIQRLVLSKLPSLGGNFPLTSTLCLRLLNLLEGSDHSDIAVTAIKSLLKLPRISFVSESGRQQVLHHLRFSIDYLRRTGLLDRYGKPMNLYGIAAHLYYTEPSNLALVTLLREGVLHGIACQSSTIDAQRDFITLMAHLFGRRYLPRTYTTDSNLRSLTRKSPSKVTLPPLSKKARDVLVEHNNEILQVFTSYAVTFVSQHKDELGRDCRLPLSGGAATSGSGEEHEETSLIRQHFKDTAIRVIVRSPFVANSGHGDSFQTVEELTRTARRGLHLHEHALPSFDKIIADSEGTEYALNGYLLDFYTHGQVKALEVANGIRRGDVWYLLQDFDLCLSTVKSVLEQLLLNASNEKASGDAQSDDFEEQEVDSGYGTLEPTEADDGQDQEDANEQEFKRPAGVSDVDWRVYEIVNGATKKFNEKYRAMWA